MLQTVFDISMHPIYLIHMHKHVRFGCCTATYNADCYFLVLAGT